VTEGKKEGIKEGRNTKSKDAGIKRERKGKQATYVMATRGVTEAPALDKQVIFVAKLKLPFSNHGSQMPGMCGECLPGLQGPHECAAYLGL
jgi:hypothetical protein